jgi:hypothetical protein
MGCRFPLGVDLRGFDPSTSAALDLEKKEAEHSVSDRDLYHFVWEIGIVVMIGRRYPYYAIRVQPVQACQSSPLYGTAQNPVILDDGPTLAPKPVGWLLAEVISHGLCSQIG